MKERRQPTLLSGADGGWKTKTFNQGVQNLTWELYRIVCESSQFHGSGLFGNDFFLSLDVPLEHQAAFWKMDEWSLRMELLCKLLVKSRKAKVPDVNSFVAGQIGKEVATLLAQGKLKAIRMLSEGLANVHSGKPFKTGGGVKTDPRTILILVAFYVIKKQGGRKPSQGQVIALLKNAGFTFSKDAVSKCFDKLGLKSLAGDARTASHRIRMNA